jgi:hypothetical protein
MAHNHFLKENLFKRTGYLLRRPMRYFSIWKSLLFSAFIIIFYLAIMHSSDARFLTKTCEYTSENTIQTVWPPSSGEVDHYLLEIRDTRFFTDSSTHNSVTMIKKVLSPAPLYQLRCEHNHSYRLRIQAVSPLGISSPFSEESTLLICDQQSPRIELNRIPPSARRRNPGILITGTFEEPNLESITVNSIPATINPSAKSFSAPVTLSAGKNHLTILARDLAGNTTTKNIQLDYSPVTIISLPTAAKIYWNGNYAYRGIYSGTTPQSFSQAVEGKQPLRLTYPGFNDYYTIIDFSDLTRDTYTIGLTPFSNIELRKGAPLLFNNGPLIIDSCSYPFVYDYGVDGTKDLLVGTMEGKLGLFTNTGTNSAPSFSDYRFIKADDKDIDAGSHAAPFMVDYNNDGASDLLVGNGEGKLLYYANQGSNATPVFSSPAELTDSEGQPLAVDSYCTPCVVDWNEDNRKDILLGSGRGTLVLYLNQGSDSEPLFAPPLSIEADGSTLDVAGFAAPFATDWNGDGKKDLLVGNGEGYIYLYLNIGTTSEPRLISSGKVKLDGQDLMVDGSAVPFSVDWNQNGKKDLILGSIEGFVYLFTN